MSLVQILKIYAPNDKRYKWLSKYAELYLKENFPVSLKGLSVIVSGLEISLKPFTNKEKYL